MSIDDLWRQVAESPDDLAARLVLADALVEAGESRGELILLQCAGTDAFSDVRANAVELASELVAANWETWLGDLALVIARPGSTFVEGMLHTILVGLHDTPEWAWPKVHGHRELSVVRRVRAQKVSNARYVALLASLPNDPEAIDVPVGVPAELAARRSHWQFRTIRYGTQAQLRVIDVATELAPLGELALLAKVCPDLQTLALFPWILPGDRIVDIVAELPNMFPGLQAIDLDDAQWIAADRLAELRALPLVRLA